MWPGIQLPVVLTPDEPAPTPAPIPDDPTPPLPPPADSPDVTPIDEPELIAGFATPAQAPPRSPVATIASDLFQTHKKISGVLDGADPSEAFLV
jgi:hypothetical protein